MTDQDTNEEQARLEARYARSLSDATRPAPARPAPDAAPVPQHDDAPEGSEQVKLEKRYSKSPRPDSDERVEGDVPSPDHERAAALQREWQEQQRADAELTGGAGYDANLEVARAAVAEFADEELRALLDGPLGDHPALIRAFARVGARLAQQRTDHDAADNAEQAKLEKRYARTARQAEEKKR